MPHDGKYEMLEGGIYGTCDWGGCNKPANQMRDGLPVCDECMNAPRFTRGTEPRRSHLARWQEKEHADIVRYLLGEMTPEETAVAESHFVLCRVCQELMKSSRDVLDCLGKPTISEEAKAEKDAYEYRRQMDGCAEISDELELASQCYRDDDFDTADVYLRKAEEATNQLIASVAFARRRLQSKR